MRATFNYTVDDGTIPEAYFHEPPPGTIFKVAGSDPHEMQVADGWSLVDTFLLDRQGFALTVCPEPCL